MKPNRYILAMELGYENPNGIKYRWLKKEIENRLGEPFDPHSEYVFMIWITEFFARTTSGQATHILLERCRAFLNKGNKNYKYGYENFSDELWVMKGVTIKQYLDYIELKESRESAEDARKKSIISIWIAIAAIVISTAIGAYSVFTAPVPPYEVKIIENPSIQEQEKPLLELQEATEEKVQDLDSLTGIK